jgi:hypothetical protein
LEDAYYLSLLVRPQPLPQPQKIVVVSVPKKNSTAKGKPVTVAKKS